MSGHVGHVNSFIGVTTTYHKLGTLPQRLKSRKLSTTSNLLD